MSFSEVAKYYYRNIHLPQTIEIIKKAIHDNKGILFSQITVIIQDPIQRKKIDSSIKEILEKTKSQSNSNRVRFTNKDLEALKTQIGVINYQTQEFVSRGLMGDLNISKENYNLEMILSLPIDQLNVLLNIILELILDSKKRAYAFLIESLLLKIEDRSIGINIPLEGDKSELNMFLLSAIRSSITYLVGEAIFNKNLLELDLDFFEYIVTSDEYKIMEKCFQFMNSRH